MDWFSIALKITYVIGSWTDDIHDYTTDYTTRYLFRTNFNES